MNSKCLSKGASVLGSPEPESLQDSLLSSCWRSSSSQLGQQALDHALGYPADVTMDAEGGGDNWWWAVGQPEQLQPASLAEDGLLHQPQTHCNTHRLQLSISESKQEPEKPIRATLG